MYERLEMPKLRALFDLLCNTGYFEDWEEVDSLLSKADHDQRYSFFACDCGAMRYPTRCNVEHSIRVYLRFVDPFNHLNHIYNRLQQVRLLDWFAMCR